MGPDLKDRFTMYNISTIDHFSESAVGPLIENLNRLWTTFQTSISSDLSDYLSVEHLAIILQKISKKGKICSCQTVIFYCSCMYIQNDSIAFNLYFM